MCGSEVVVQRGETCKTCCHGGRRGARDKSCETGLRKRGFEKRCGQGSCDRFCLPLDPAKVAANVAAFAKNPSGCDPGDPLCADL
jgi:hypothetical protein